MKNSAQMRKETKIWVVNTLVKNGKFFVAPQHDGSNFKQLFARLAAEGVGRPADRNGSPDGPWTPELLTKAICAIEGNQKGIEIRSVQLWFQENDNGISRENIRWLARIFGCNDPEAISQWQSILWDAKEQQKNERRTKKRLSDAASETTLNRASVSEDHQEASTTHQQPRLSFMNIAGRSEALFVGQKAFSLVIFSWTIYVMIGLLNFIFGLHSITYSPFEGLDKQVGFLWAPTWTILPLIILPLFIIFFGEMLTFWRVETRPMLVDANETTWGRFVAVFSLPVWAITLVCAGFVFGLQWFGIYARIYWLGDVGQYQVDRTLITLIEPDSVSTFESIIASLFGYIYAGWFIWIFLVIMLFLYIISADFLATVRRMDTSDIDLHHLRYVSMRLMVGVFQCSVLGIWIAISIKLQGAFLSSDSANILSWLLHDGLSDLSSSHERPGLLGNQATSYFTTSLMLGIILVVIVSSLFQITRALKQAQYDDDDEAVQNDAPINAVQVFFVITLLSASLLSIGQVGGFSIVLLTSVVASIYYVAKITIGLR